MLDILQFEIGGIVPEHLGFDPDTSNLDRKDKSPERRKDELTRALRRMVQNDTDRTPAGLELHKAIEALEQKMDEKQI